MALVTPIEALTFTLTTVTADQIQAATDIINAWSRFRFEEETFADEMHFGDGSRDLKLNHIPVKVGGAITVTIYYGNIDGNITVLAEQNDFTLLNDIGVLRYPGGIHAFDWGEDDRVKVTYTAGFPAGHPWTVKIKPLCARIAACLAINPLVLPKLDIGTYKGTYSGVTENSYIQDILNQIPKGDM